MDCKKILMVAKQGMHEPLKFILIPVKEKPLIKLSLGRWSGGSSARPKKKTDYIRL